MILSEEEKKAAVREQLDRKLAWIGDMLQDKVDAVFKSGGVPPHFYENDQQLMRAILDSYCRDREFKPHQSQQGDFDNIHRCG